MRVARGQALSERVTLSPGETTITLATVDAAGNRGGDARVRVTRASGARLPAGLTRLPAGVSAGQREGEWVHDKTKIVLVWVAPGTFRMGFDGAGAFDWEKPVHEVRLTRGYFVGKHEVTWGQYRAFCQATGGTAPSNAIEYEGHFEATDQHPVFNVSWDDAQSFCQWSGLRLPTEAEWEYAARGTDGRTFPWGSQDPGTTRCNLGKYSPTHTTGDFRDGRDGHLYTAPVGSFPAGASPRGALDMAGNVWEWVQDWYDTYTGGTQTDPPGAASGTYRARRGGSWDGASTNCRASYRNRDEPAYRVNYLGFRVVLSSPQ